MKRLLTTILMFSCLTPSLLAQAHRSDSSQYTNAPDRREASTGSAITGESLQARPWQLASKTAYMSKAQAIDIARRKVNGKILSAELIQNGQHAYYKIKVLTDQGRIKVLQINAQAKKR